jgi:lipopolysaccharide biosynthesis regulator YciM
MSCCESRALPRSYFKGLNFLLNEQPDQAIEAFIEAARSIPRPVELHFALGNLFRRRGETDRAIRMHQNLIERDGLSEEQRLHALSELGQDYLKAGLLDRAEEIFSSCAAPSADEAALNFLLEIYQQEKEWRKAIDIAEAMPNHSGHLWQKEIAEFYCELAATKCCIRPPRRSPSPAGTRRWRRTASRCGPPCCWANCMPVGRWRTAIDHWKRIEQQNPVYLSLVAEKLMAAYRKLGRSEQGLQLLRGWLEQHPSLDLLDAVFRGSWMTRAPRRPIRSWCATNCGAIRPCSAWTSCSRRRSWSRRPSGAPTWNW